MAKNDKYMGQVPAILTPSSRRWSCAATVAALGVAGFEIARVGTPFDPHAEWERSATFTIVAAEQRRNTGATR
jgi:hypothetical protein